MNFLKKLFGKEDEKPPVVLAPVTGEKWFTDEDFGPTRMWSRSDGMVEFYWLEEESPFCARFSSIEKAKSFMEELKPSNSKEHWSFKDEDILLIETDTWDGE